MYQKRNQARYLVRIISAQAKRACSPYSTGRSIVGSRRRPIATSQVMYSSRLRIRVVRASSYMVRKLVVSRGFDRYYARSYVGVTGSRLVYSRVVPA